MHSSSMMVAVALFVIGLGFISKFPKVAYTFFGLGALMVWAGATG